MTHSDSRIAVYTGSFDPVTLGHLNVIERAARLVDTLIVGVGINTEKAALFSPEQRMELLAQATSHVGNVDVRSQGHSTRRSLFDLPLGHLAIQPRFQVFCVSDRIVVAERR